MSRYKYIPSDVKTIVFDWDGTLHESIFIYKPAFLEAFNYLVNNNYVSPYEWTDKEIASFLGKSPKEMWESFEPKLANEVIEKGSSINSMHMLKLIKEGKAKLYSGAIEVLEELKKTGYTLVYLSNSKSYYMNAMISSFSLEKYFDMFYCSEMFDYIPKFEILAKVKNILPQKMLVVGDRSLDIETGIKNNAYTIGCLYGYGKKEELRNANYLINSINDLVKKVDA